MSKNLQQTRNISPAARAEMFAQMTRQHLQPMAPVAGAEGARVSFTLPKSRLLTRTMLEVTATLNAIHASNTAYTPAAFAPYSFIQQVRVETNTGFTPVRLSGRSLYLMNLLSHQAQAFTPVYVGTSRGRAVQGVVAASGGGANNVVRFMLDLGAVLNDRDPAGMVLLQNEETVVTVHIDFGTVADLAPAAAGFTFAVSNIAVAPLVETFSIPQVREAFPDLSILKLVQEQTQPIAGAGALEVKLPTGTTYRKLCFFITNAAGAGITDAGLNGDIELIFNQADTPYRLRPTQLAAINAKHYGQPLPNGFYAFDFSAHMGLPNYSGARDYVDTERLTECWLRINPAAAGNITVMYEILSQLRG